MNVKTFVSMFMGVVSISLAESCHCDRGALSAGQRRRLKLQQRKGSSLYALPSSAVCLHTPPMVLWQPVCNAWVLDSEERGDLRLLCILLLYVLTHLLLLCCDSLCVMLEFQASLHEMLDLREIIKRDICLLEFLLVQLRPVHNSDRIIIWFIEGGQLFKVLLS